MRRSALFGDLQHLHLQFIFHSLKLHFRLGALLPAFRLDLENFIERAGFEPRNVAGRLMSAKPYAMDAGYKDTVLASLRDGLSRWLPERGGVHR